MGRERPVEEHRRPSWIMWTAFAMRFKACQQGADRMVSEQEHKRAGADNNRGRQDNNRDNAVRTVSKDRRDRADNNRGRQDNTRDNAVRTVSKDRRDRADSKVDNRLEASSRDREVNADRRKVDNRAAAHNRAGSRLAASRVAHRAAVRLANEVIVVATGRMDRVEI